VLAELDDVVLLLVVLEVALLTVMSTHQPQETIGPA
jgi:hypothetical protein